MPQDIPDGSVYSFVNGVEAALEKAKHAAGDKDVSISGGNVGGNRALGGWSLVFSSDPARRNRTGTCLTAWYACAEINIAFRCVSRIIVAHLLSR